MQSRPPRSQRPLRPPGGKATEQAGRKGRLRRLFTYSCGAVLALAVVLYLLRGALVEPFLRSWIAATVSDALGPTIEIGDISGSYFTGLEFRDVETIKEGVDGPLVSLGAGRLTLHYSLLSLLGGPDAFLGRLEIDLQEARAALAIRESAGKDEAPAPLSLPGTLPYVRIGNSALSVTGTGFAIALSGMEIEIDGRSSPATIAVVLGEVLLSHSRLKERAFALQADLRYTPETITVGEMLVDGRPVVEEGRLTLEGLPENFSLAMQAQPFGGRLAFQGERKEGAFAFFAQAERLDVGSAAGLFLLDGITPGGTLSFQSQGRLAPHLPFGAEGEITLSLEEGTLRGVNVVDLRLEAGLREGQLFIGDLEAVAGESALSLREGRLPLGRLVAGEWRDLLLEAEAGAALHSADIPSFLALWGVAMPAGREDVPAHELRLAGRLAQGTLDIHEGALAMEGGRAALSRAALSFPPAAAGWGKTALNIEGDVDIGNAAILGNILPLPPLGGAVRGRVSVEGAVTALQGVLEAEAENLVVDGRPAGNITLTVEADSEHITLRQGEMRQEDKNVLRVTGASLPADVLFSGEGGRIVRSLSGQVSLQLEDIPHFLETFGVSRKREAELIPGHLLALEGSIDGGNITLSSGKLETPQGSVTVAEGRATLPGEGEDLLLTQIDAGLTADLPDLRVLADLFAGPPLGGALRGTAQVRGTLRDTHGTVSADIAGLAYGGLLFGDAALKAAVGAGRLDLERCEVRQGEDRLAASGSLHFDGLRLDDGALDVRIEDVASYTAGLIPDKWQPRGTLEGSLSLAGTLTVPEGALKASLHDGAIGDIEVSGINVSLSATEGTVLIRSLEAETGLGSFALHEETRITYGGDKGTTIANTSIEAPPGLFRIGGSIGPDGALDLALDAEGLSGEGWLEEIIGDRIFFSGADLALQVAGSLDRPRMSATGAVADLRGKNSPEHVSGVFDLVYAEGTLQVQALSLTGAGGQMKAAGSIPLGPAGAGPAGPLNMTVSVDVPDLEAYAVLFPEDYAPRGALRGEVLWGGTLDNPDGTVELEAVDLFIPDTIKAVPPGPYAISVHGSWTGAEVLVDLLRVDSEALTVKAAGNWQGAPAPGAILKGGPVNFAGDVTLEAQFDVPDIAWIAGAVEGFRQAGGSVAGSLAVAGPFTDPDITASLEIRDGEISFTGFPLLSALDGSLTFAGKQLDLKDVAGEIGGSPTQLVGSLFFDDDWEPAFDLHLTGKRLLLYRGEGVRVRADTEISLQGPLAALEIEGVISIADSHFARNIDFLGSLGGHKRPPVSGKSMLFSFKDPPLRDMRFNLALKTVEPFIVRNQYLRGAVRPDLVLKGTGEVPALVGKVAIDPSRLFLPAGVLRTESGAVSFLERSPARPWIDLKGSTRLMGYDISMSVEGFVDDPRITLSSLPPLPNDELLLLVMLGTPPASGDNAASGSAGTALAVFLGRGFLGRFFGSGHETEEMILDRFETTVGRDITEKGEPTIDSTFRLQDDFLWKGGTLYLTGEKDRYDEVNYGVRLIVQFEDKEHGDE